VRLTQLNYLKYSPSRPPMKWLVAMVPVEVPPGVNMKLYRAEISTAILFVK
jgi:hypothetical protein